MLDGNCDKCAVGDTEHSHGDMGMDSTPNEGMAPSAGEQMPAEGDMNGSEESTGSDDTPT